MPERPTPVFLEEKPNTKELLNATMKWEVQVPLVPEGRGNTDRGRNANVPCTSLTDHSAMHHHHVAKVDRDQFAFAQLPHYSYARAPAPVPLFPAPQVPATTAAVSCSYCGDRLNRTGFGQSCCCGLSLRASLPPPPPPPAVWTAGRHGRPMEDFLLLVDDSCRLADCGEDSTKE